ncbi:MAG: chemotaxis protein CheB [Rhizobiaceae bacterium]|nr:chemotaxis protein CheB [Rhizobiaceae bacterium]
MIRLLLITTSPDLAGRTAAALRMDTSMTLAGIARDGEQALAMSNELRPDVVAIELELAGHDGADAIKEIMIASPRPVVAIAGPGGGGAGAISDKALEAGALAVIPAPLPDDHPSMGKFLSTIRAMAQVMVVRQRRRERRHGLEAELPAGRARYAASVVGIAASTGGPAALRTILTALPATFPAPVLVVQHMSDGFIEGVAARLDATVSLTVRIAVDGERLRPGFVYLAPDGRQLGLSGKTRIRVTDDAPVGAFRPSATYLFRAMADCFKEEALAVVLTGMGDDGIAGLGDIRRRGGRIIAQDENTSTVFGMPKAAILAGLADDVLPLETIADKLVSLASRPATG